jgi:hypothetical protein
VRNRWVTTKKAKEVLEKLGPWLDKRPPLRKFTDRLDATVGTVWPLACIAGLYVNLDGALTRLGMIRCVMRLTASRARSPRRLVNGTPFDAAHKTRSR